MTRIHAARSSSFKDNGKLVEYFVGDVVENTKHIKLLDGWSALVPEGEEHLTPEERLNRALNPDAAMPLNDAPSPGSPAGGTEDRITGDYASGDHTAEQLKAEVDARIADGRDINVTGTGSGGNVLRGDLEKALTADDASQASS